MTTPHSMADVSLPTDRSRSAYVPEVTSPSAGTTTPGHRLRPVARVGLEPIRVLSLGAGVQSSTLYLMAVDGAFGKERPEVAIFADTGWEPAAVYDHLARLESIGGGTIPIRRVSGGDLRAASLMTRINGVTGRTSRVVSLPLYVRNADGSTGTLNRQCTRDFKVRPIRRDVRVLLAERGRRTAVGAVEQWIGISLDEASRMKPSGVRFIVNRFPLIEEGMDRRACERRLARWGIVAPKSACISCPYTSDARRRERRDNSPEDWAADVAYDAAIRRLPEVQGECFVHRSLVPLDQVDLSTATERGQANLFENECTGLCGV